MSGRERKGRERQKQEEGGGVKVSLEPDFKGFCHDFYVDLAALPSPPPNPPVLPHILGAPSQNQPEKKTSILHFPL